MKFRELYMKKESIYYTLILENYEEEIEMESWAS